MTEKQIEKRLIDGVNALGGIAYKFTSPGNVGAPDRVVILPGGEVWFLELKTEHGSLSAMQGRQLTRIRKLGGNALCLYGASFVDDFLEGRRRSQARRRGEEG